MSNEASKQLFWTASLGKLPYIDFNTNGVRNKSTYFRTGYVPNAKTTIEMVFSYLANPALITGHQHGCRTGWVAKAFQLNTAFGPGIYECWPAWNSDNSFLVDIDQREYQFPKLMCFKMASGGKVYFNDNLLHDFNQPYAGISYEWFIGDVNERGNPKGSSDSQGSARWHLTNIYEDEKRLHSFAPFLLNDEICIKDFDNDVVVQQSKCNGGVEIQYGELG